MGKCQVIGNSQIAQKLLGALGSLEGKVFRMGETKGARVDQKTKIIWNTMGDHNSSSETKLMGKWICLVTSTKTALSCRKIGYKWSRQISQGQ